MMGRLSAWIVQMLLVACFLPECRPESPPSIEQPGSGSTRSLEDELLRLTNLHRRSRGLAPLIVDEHLTVIAREQSMGMARQGFISHDLPSGSLDHRLVQAGYQHVTAIENVAHCRTLTGAHKSLLQSPPHERNILDENSTRVGIGIVRSPAGSGGGLYITEIFAKPRERHELSAVQDMFLAKVEEDPDLPVSARPDPLLEEIASDSVHSINFPVEKEELRDLLAASAGRMRRNGRSELSRLDVSVQLLEDPAGVKVPRQIWEQGASTFGSAVREVTTPRNQRAFLILTLIGFSN